MKEYPILFSAPMVRAILDGCKTQTRRTSDRWAKCNPGDRLWVKETFQWLHLTTDFETGLVDGCVYPTSRLADVNSGYYIPVYSADGAFDIPKIDRGFPWKPSIYMPRSASRITLEVVSIRQERLWAMSREDAWSEGIGYMNGHTGSKPTFDAVRRFAELWDEINGKIPHNRWDSNPLVWRIEFMRVTE